MPLFSNNSKEVLASGLLLEGNTVCQISSWDSKFLVNSRYCQLPVLTLQKHGHRRQIGRRTSVTRQELQENPSPCSRSLAISRQPQQACFLGLLAPGSCVRQEREANRRARTEMGREQGHKVWENSLWPTQWTWLFLFNMQFFFWWQSKSRCSEIAYYPPPTICAWLPRGASFKV